MSVTANILQKLGVRLTLDDVDGAGTSLPIDITEFDRRIALSASTTPPITMVGFDSHTLAGTPETIDLTAIPNELEGGTADGTGLKLQAAMFIMGSSNNAAGVTIDVTSSNPCDAFGSSFSVLLEAGGGVVLYSPEGGSDISGTVKTFEFNGTAADVINYIVLMG